ncbi:ankyrin [Cucurbitaria berberidis CBS 394.84]|uniref:Ankyrin n=1 Tax=Cucurbitaria berberidis CBS 394.84 TaxID=1168544 RepID=A0A9P4LA19_9PLEO|nr:ankyrin [Cucurbitaria berberidis CBS 394.84]KAF1847625.1 ankyrin [Cucurbitaria berberidis CBS 394.84]
MTKDWNAVQEEIKELSFNQKKSLEEVKELMERKYKFRASTRAYRMKLKEWGFMRHKPRKITKDSNEVRERSRSSHGESDVPNRESSATVDPTSIDTIPSTVCEKPQRWQIVENADTDAEPTFMSLLGRARDLQPSFDPWSEARTRASGIVLDMLSAILDKDSEKLEKLIVENVNHVNDPIGLPFDSPNSRFFGHPALSQMVILQHSDQKLLDIACGMPCGPIIWVLLSHGATGSKHPLGTDLALHNAIKNGRPYTVQALLVPGRSNVNGVPGTSWKPLLQAVFWNVPEVVRILLTRGADIEDAGPSPMSTGSHTALQLCLEYRATNYLNQTAKERCHQILKMLLDAGANTHVALVEGATQSPFEVFIRPWQGVPYWTMGLTETELDCFRIFVSKGANSQAQFDGYPCRSLSSTTFEHQVIWHSTPSIARLLIDSFAICPHSNGSSLLHELLGSCSEAKRHPVDTLRDLEVLLQKGVDPNLADINGATPLEKCIKQCPAVDLVARLQMLLERGADPESKGYSGVQPYVSAARTFEQPLLSEVMEALVLKIRGRYIRHVDGVPHTWANGIFPISETQSYEQVMSCTRKTGDFMLNMQSMIPGDAQQVFQRAYFTVVSKHFLDTMTRVAKMKMLNTNEKNEIVWVISMRKVVDCPEYKFDQELVVALLDPQPFPSMALDMSAEATRASTLPQESTSSTIASPASSLTITGNATSPQVHTLFQFNSNSSATSDQAISTSKSPVEATSLVDDYFIPSTTQIRWHDPCAQPKPGDLNKAAAAVLEFSCSVCGAATLLTKNELEKHGVEHAHSESCTEVGCTRRFCAAKRINEVLL